MAQTKSVKETPLMKQYNAIKAKHPGALLLFRVGDFYETFGSDAIKASKILDIVLTKRANGAASSVELAGFPHHALDSYLPKLVRAGERVAICDQLEDPKLVKGIVKRGVTELVTPGLAYHDQVLDKGSNNFLASLHGNKDYFGIALLDVSTGEFFVSQGSTEYVQKILQSFKPSEVIYSKGNRNEIDVLVEDVDNIYQLDEWVYQFDYGYDTLTQHFHTNTLKGFGIEDLPEAITAAGAILFYLDSTEHKEINHILSISRIDEDNHVWLDKFTIRNLELTRPQQDNGIPLIDVLNHTVTPMGSRLIKKWIVLPLKSIEDIHYRLKIVEVFTKDEILRDDILKNLKQVADLERLISKVAVGRVNPRELLQLRKTLELIAPIRIALIENGTNGLKEIAEVLDPCTSLIEKLQKEMKDEVPLLIHQGGIINDGIHKELDELRKIAFSGKDYLMHIREREIKNTGIPSLKIAYNKVFGYYLEVSNTHKDKVPTEWLRKQTLVNAERYITEELKIYEEKILNAEEKLISIEQLLFQNLVTDTAKYTALIQQNAQVLAKIDCLLSFAQVSISNRYTLPEINDSYAIQIRNGRHAVIEQQLPLGEKYVPNDVFLDNDHQQIMIITGPNMSGKSALLRQTALIVLLAQMGCFVPAEKAEIGIVDKVFTRVGASDNLSQGESTFMVEMTETASILNNLSDRSLILMDEIGRGTSTYDGVSIAWSITEYLHNNPDHRPKTLFATHYHELNQLTNDLPRVKNFNVSIKEAGDRVLFMRKLKEGGSEHSFGIHVAQMAGMPNPVVLRANEIMRFLEKDHKRNDAKKRITQMKARSDQMSLFQSDPRFDQVKSLLDSIDINTISPVEALLKLNEVKSLLKNGGKDHDK